MVKAIKVNLIETLKVYHAEKKFLSRKINTCEAREIYKYDDMI